MTWEAGDNERRPQWALCIQDTGPGFERGYATPLERVLKIATTEAHEVEARNSSPDQQASLQADSAPTLASQTPPPMNRLPSGEGIGLSIVQRAVERMGGRVSMDSEVGRGSRFHVELREA